jgi:hypothetical protein
MKNMMCRMNDDSSLQEWLEIVEAPTQFGMARLTSDPISSIRGKKER